MRFRLASRLLGGVFFALPLAMPASGQVAGNEGSDAAAGPALSKHEHIEWVVAQLNARAVVPPGDAPSETGEPAGPAGQAASVIYNTATGAGCSIDIALVAAESATNSNDVRAKLLADPRIDSVTVINTQAVTPAVEDLLAFDSVMVWTNFTPLDSVALGDAVADYVDAGGGVVLAMFVMRVNLATRTLQGRFLTDNYYCIQRSIGNSTTGQASLGTVHVPGSPVMAGVRTFDGGSLSFRSPTGPHPNATRIVSWSSGEVLAAVRTDLSGQRVDLGFFPVSSDVSANYWQTSTDGALLMANAMAYTAGCPHPGDEGCAPALFSQAPPDPTLTGRNSNTASNTFSTQQEADNFSIPGGGSVSRITLWSTYTGDNSVPNAQRFVINIFNNVANNPGAIIYTASAVVVPEYTGLIQTGFATPRRLYRFTIDLTTPFVAANGVTYWLNPMGNTNDKQWCWQFFDTPGDRRFRAAPGDPWSSADDGTFAFDLCASCAGAVPPVVEITAPPSFTCGCGVVQISGTATDPGGFYAGDRLEYRRSDLEAWTLADTANAPRVGVLYNWAVPGPLIEGWYFLRVTGENDCGLSSSDMTIVRISRDFDAAILRGPLDGNILGGTVCFDGTAEDNNCFRNYTVMYRPAGVGAFAPVDPAIPVYNTPVHTDPLAAWSTNVGPTAVPDGDYDVRLRGTDQCGNVSEQVETITVDNTPPVCVITTPLDCAYVDGVVQVRGTANDANLAGWALQYTGDGTHGWVTINQGNAPVINGLFANWDTTRLPICAYSLRLVVSDRSVVNCGPSTHQLEYHVSVNVGLLCDINQDGAVDAFDIEPFINCLFP